MSKIATVNVIQIDDDGNVSSIRSWTNTPEGKAAAEKEFVKIIKEHTSETAYADEEFQAMIDEGFCDDISVGFKIFITQSE